MDALKRSLRFATVAVHGRRRLRKDADVDAVRSVSPPIYQSSTFALDSAAAAASLFRGETEGYVYTRLGNPTQSRFEVEMAFLEEGEAALAFSSGMAAIASVVLGLCTQGTNLVAANSLYGGTHDLFARTLPRLGIEAREVDARSPDALDAAIDRDTRMVFIETPSNPTLRLVDIEKTARLAHRHGIPLVVDSTFCTPYLQRPLSLGADVVVHSATKYIGGHGDTVAGVAVGRRELVDRLRYDQLRDLGGVISPFNAWLLLRGLKTLPVRMERHGSNALEVAHFLSGHPKVREVIYPGLRSHPDHALASRQQDGYGGMVTFELEGGRDAGCALLDSVELWTLAVSLGDIDSLIEHPASMTHSTYSEEELGRAGIGPGLVRLSVGLEDPADLIYDLEQALRGIHRPPASSLPRQP